RLTARSTRASTVTWNSGTAVLASTMRRAIVACMRFGSTISISALAAVADCRWAPPVGGRTRRACGQHVLLDDPALGSRALDRGQVDAHLAGEPAGKRGSLDPAVVPLLAV